LNLGLHVVALLSLAFHTTSIVVWGSDSLSREELRDHALSLSLSGRFTAPTVFGLRYLSREAAPLLRRRCLFLLSWFSRRRCGFVAPHEITLRVESRVAGIVICPVLRLAKRAEVWFLVRGSSGFRFTIEFSRSAPADPVPSPLPRLGARVWTAFSSDTAYHRHAVQRVSKIPPHLGCRGPLRFPESKSRARGSISLPLFFFLSPVTPPVLRWFFVQGVVSCPGVTIRAAEYLISTGSDFFLAL
jgi:hypothetical protein